MFSALSIEISSGAPNGEYTVVGYTTSCGCQVCGSIERPPQPYSTMKPDGVLE